MKRTRKPVHECHHCPLNLGDRCLIHDCPHDMWRHRKCATREDEALLKRYQEDMTRQLEDERKTQRRELAKQCATEDHHQGVRPTGAMSH